MLRAKLLLSFSRSFNHVVYEDDIRTESKFPSIIDCLIVRLFISFDRIDWWMDITVCLSATRVVNDFDIQIQIISFWSNIYENNHWTKTMDNVFYHLKTKIILNFLSKKKSIVCCFFSMIFFHFFYNDYNIYSHIDHYVCLHFVSIIGYINYDHMDIIWSTLYCIQSFRYNIFGNFHIFCVWTNNNESEREKKTIWWSLRIIL